MPEETSTHLVFVYGTLKKDQRNHSFLTDRGAEFVGNAKTAKPYPLINAQLPYLINVPGFDGAQIVEGEVYRVNTQTLKELDRLEGTPTHYARKKIGVELSVELCAPTPLLQEVQVYFRSSKSQLPRWLKAGFKMLSTFDEKATV